MNFEKSIYVVALDRDPEMANLAMIGISHAFGPIVCRKFTDGDEAWAEIKSNPPNLFITDSNHKGMSLEGILGAMLAHKIKSPVIVASANYQSQQIVAEARNYGMEISYIEKPYQLSEIAALVAPHFRTQKKKSNLDFAIRFLWPAVALFMFLTYLWATRLQHTSQNGRMVIYNRYTGEILFPKFMVDYQKKQQQ